MERQDLDQAREAPAPGPGSGPRRRSFTFRLLTLAVVAITTGLVLVACGPGGTRPYSHVSPESPTADSIQSLYKLIFWMALVVFIGVQAAIVYTALRFRQRGQAAERPEQVHGNKRLEITWTVIPAIVLLIILIPTITTMYEFDAAAEEGDLIVDVYGKQWWWEIHYPELGVVTANEIVVPVNQNVVYRLHSNNVIHSFWVPRLSGKLDLIPGHINQLSITAREPGEYHGECAEFCGASHAWMRFKIIAVELEDFNTWIDAWSEPPAQEAAAFSGDVTQTPGSYAACLACHSISGTNANVAQEGITADPYSLGAGPNLTHFGCRETLAAGLLINNEENLKEWLRHPGEIKEDNYMALAIEPGTLTEEQIDELAGYLLSLKPEGGCISPGAEQPDDDVALAR